MPTPTDVLNLLISEIKGRFADTPLVFGEKVYSDRQELWVYVEDTNRYQEVDEFCKTLDISRTDARVPISIIAKPGPWPSGQSVEELRKRRNEFLKRLQTQPQLTPINGRH